MLRKYLLIREWIFNSFLSFWTSYSIYQFYFQNRATIWPVFTRLHYHLVNILHLLSAEWSQQYSNWPYYFFPFSSETCFLLPKSLVFEQHYEWSFLNIHKIILLLHSNPPMTPSSFTAKGKNVYLICFYLLLWSRPLVSSLWFVAFQPHWNRTEFQHTRHILLPREASSHLLFLLGILFSRYALRSLLSLPSALLKYCYWRHHVWSSYETASQSLLRTSHLLLWFSFPLFITCPTEYLLISDCLLLLLSKMASLIGQVLGQVCSLLHHQCLGYFASSISICREWMDQWSFKVMSFTKSFLTLRNSLYSI